VDEKEQFGRTITGCRGFSTDPEEAIGEKMALASK
jgi:hypothetical protein